MVALNKSELFELDYVGALNLYPFLNSTGANMIGLMTLTYVPNYFDILPMYLVILGMVPVVMALSRIHVLLPLAVLEGMQSRADKTLRSSFCGSLKSINLLALSALRFAVASNSS